MECPHPSCLGLGLLVSSLSPRTRIVPSKWRMMRTNAAAPGPHRHARPGRRSEPEATGDAIGLVGFFGTGTPLGPAGAVYAFRLFRKIELVRLGYAKAITLSSCETEENGSGPRRPPDFLKAWVKPLAESICTCRKHQYLACPIARKMRSQKDNSVAFVELDRTRSTIGQTSAGLG